MQNKLVFEPNKYYVLRLGFDSYTFDELLCLNLDDDEDVFCFGFPNYIKMADLKNNMIPELFLPVYVLNVPLLLTLEKLDVFSDKLQQISLSQVICFKDEYKISEPIAEVNNYGIMDKEFHITIHGCNCQFFWNLCYGILKSWNEMQINNCNVNQEINEAYECFKIGMSLFLGYNRNLLFTASNPYNNWKDRYVRFANNIYVFGMAFFVCHELSHLELGHAICYSDSENLDKIRKEEYDADKSAIWLMNEVLLIDDKNKLWAEYGIVIAICSLIFIDNSLDGGDEHPKPITRIVKTLEILDNDFDCIDDVWGIACNCLMTWHYYYYGDYVFPENQHGNMKNYFFEITQFIENGK